MDNQSKVSYGAPQKFLAKERFSFQKFLDWNQTMQNPKKRGHLYDPNLLLSKKSSFLDASTIKEFDLVVQKDEGYELIYIPMNKKKSYYSFLLIKEGKS